MESADLILIEFKSELQRWNTHWKGKNTDTFFFWAIDFLSRFDLLLYPRVNFLLQVAATIPVSNATAERTFPTLRRLETWLRTNMNQDQLTG